MPQTRAKTQRLQLGLTLRALADRCAAQGVTVDNSQLSKIERGKNVPRPKLRAVLADILEIGVDEFEKRTA